MSFKRENLGLFKQNLLKFNLINEEMCIYNSAVYYMIRYDISEKLYRNANKTPPYDKR